MHGVLGGGTGFTHLCLWGGPQPPEDAVPQCPRRAQLNRGASKQAPSLWCPLKGATAITGGSGLPRQGARSRGAGGGCGQTPPPTREDEGADPHPVRHGEVSPPSAPQPSLLPAGPGGTRLGGGHWGETLLSGPGSWEETRLGFFWSWRLCCWQDAGRAHALLNAFSRGFNGFWPIPHHLVGAHASSK